MKGTYLLNSALGQSQCRNYNPCCLSVCCSDTATAITKQCASQATCRGAASTASVDSNGNGNAVSCCSSYDLCNFSKADSINRNNKLLLLTVGVGFLLSRWAQWDAQTVQTAPLQSPHYLQSYASCKYCLYSRLFNKKLLKYHCVLHMHNWIS